MAGSTGALICDTGALLDYLVESAPDHRLYRSAIDRAPHPVCSGPRAHVSIRLTATSDGTAVVGGFNSANKTLTVIRE